MASEVASVTTPAASLVHGSQAPKIELHHSSGNTLPQSGKVTALPAAAPQQTNVPKAVTPPAANAQQQAQQAQEAQQKQSLAGQVAVLNKFLNDSGRPAQFRASSNNKVIEEINPATGEVIAEYSASVFAALAKSVGISGAVVNSHA
jgi:uncharacterized FlaG/YvyC family protein